MYDFNFSLYSLMFISNLTLTINLFIKSEHSIIIHLLLDWSHSRRLKMFLFKIKHKICVDSLEIVSLLNFHQGLMSKLTTLGLDGNVYFEAIHLSWYFSYSTKWKKSWKKIIENNKETFKIYFKSRQKIENWPPKLFTP